MAKNDSTFFAKICVSFGTSLNTYSKYFKFYIAFVLISSSSFSVNSSADISPSSPALLERTVNVPASASLSPIVHRYESLWFLASLIL